jgi:hypothetical protein
MMHSTFVQLLLGWSAFLYIATFVFWLKDWRERKNHNRKK